MLASWTNSNPETIIQYAKAIVSCWLCLIFVLAVYLCGSILSVQILITMTVLALHTSIFVLMTIAMTAQSTHHFAPQVVYQKLEHALTTDSNIRYLMQQKFFPSQKPSPDIVFIYVNITVNSMGVSESCGGHHPLPDKLIKFPYYQKFQWSKFSLTQPHFK